MLIKSNSDKPIFIQIAEGIEDAVLSGAFPEESQIPSITEFSINYKINPATALKGINILVDAEIVYKKRGLGMFVCSGAADKLRSRRKEQFFDNYVKVLTDEAKRLQISENEVKLLIERGFENERD